MHRLPLSSLRLECKSTGISGSTLGWKLLSGSPRVRAASVLRPSVKRNSSLGARTSYVSDNSLRTWIPSFILQYWCCNGLKVEKPLSCADVRPSGLGCRLFRSAVWTWATFLESVCYHLEPSGQFSSGYLVSARPGRRASQSKPRLY